MTKDGEGWQWSSRLPTTTELRERVRAATWGGSKITKTIGEKEGKVWCTALESFKKIMLEGMQEISDKLTEKLFKKINYLE